MTNALVLTSQGSGQIAYPGQLQRNNESISRKRVLDRAPQMCMTCGHYRQRNNIYNEKHVDKCTVPEFSYCKDRSVHVWCPCNECVAGADRVGYCRPLEVLKYTRAPKMCRICGHFKHIGHYKYKHTDRECKVDNTDRCIERYKSYCSCEHCTETAELSGIPNALKPIGKVMTFNIDIFI